MRNPRFLGALRRAIFLSFVAIGILAFTAPVQGITNGQLDDEHTYVGSIVIGAPQPDDPYQLSIFQWCSGSLIAPTVFLTAGHCVADLAVYWPGVTPESGLLWITFAPVIWFADLDEFYRVEAIAAHPDYNWGPMSDPHDVGVFLLAEPVSTISEFGRLPQAGYLERLVREGMVGSATDPVFANVGYGETRSAYPDGFRMISYSAFLSLHKAWLYMTMNEHVGSGGTCYGDSGGPTLYQEGDVEYIVAVTSWGDVPCKATNINYRVDTESSLSFISGFLSP